MVISLIRQLIELKASGSCTSDPEWAGDDSLDESASLLKTKDTPQLDPEDQQWILQSCANNANQGNELSQVSGAKRDERSH